MTFRTAQGPHQLLRYLQDRPCHCTLWRRWFGQPEVIRKRALRRLARLLVKNQAGGITASLVCRTSRSFQLVRRSDTWECRQKLPDDRAFFSGGNSIFLRAKKCKKTLHTHSPYFGKEMKFSATASGACSARLVKRTCATSRFRKLTLAGSTT